MQSHAWPINTSLMIVLVMYWSVKLVLLFLYLWEEHSARTVDNFTVFMLLFCIGLFISMQDLI